MEPITTTKNGITISVIDIKKNNRYACTDDCWCATSCSIKAKCMQNKVKEELVATEVDIALTNATADPVTIDARFWELVDTEGFSCGATALCDSLIAPRTVNPSSWSVSPSTRVKFQLIFPEMDPELNIAAIIFSSRNTFFRMDLMELPPEISSLLSVRDEIAVKKAIEQDYKFRNILSEVENIRKHVFARFNNVLTPKERVNHDNAIANLRFTIEEYLRKALQWQKDLIEPDFLQAINEYEQKISTAQEEEAKNKKIAQKVEQLYDLTPREFEEWTESLFNALGYDNVILTPQSGDKGIDLIAEKDGKKIVVQCKKFKGVVGSPMLQAFLGAIQTSEADKGFFITTGTFSVEAEKMAEDAPVELYDKIALRDLIERAMQ